MSLFSSIASTVLTTGVKSYLGSQSDGDGVKAPRYKVTKVSGTRGVSSVTAGRPVTAPSSADVGSLERLAQKHESLMSAFSVDRGAVSGKYGSMKV